MFSGRFSNLRLYVPFEVTVISAMLFSLKVAEKLRDDVYMTALAPCIGMERVAEIRTVPPVRDGMVISAVSPLTEIEILFPSIDADTPIPSTVVWRVDTWDGVVDS